MQTGKSQTYEDQKGGSQGSDGQKYQGQARDRAVISTEIPKGKGSPEIAERQREERPKPKKGQNEGRPGRAKTPNRERKGPKTNQSLRNTTPSLSISNVCILIVYPNGRYIEGHGSGRREEQKAECQMKGRPENSRRPEETEGQKTAEGQKV